MAEVTYQALLEQRIRSLESENGRLRKVEQEQQGVLATRDAALGALEKAEKDRDIYKDAFKDATMANTVAAKNLAEQEAKTVEYRAAWIKAQRERDHYRTLLLDERRGRRILELESGWVEGDR